MAAQSAWFQRLPKSSTSCVMDTAGTNRSTVKELHGNRRVLGEAHRRNFQSTSLHLNMQGVTYRVYAHIYVCA